MGVGGGGRFYVIQCNSMAIFATVRKTPVDTVYAQPPEAGVISWHPATRPNHATAHPLRRRPTLITIWYFTVSNLPIILNASRIRRRFWESAYNRFSRCWGSTDSKAITKSTYRRTPSTLYLRNRALSLRINRFVRNSAYSFWAPTFITS